MMRLFFITALSLLVLFTATPGSAVDRPPNILLIIVDDLRPELGSYGSEHIHSPNMDRLAEQGVLFERAYSNVPVCGASRASMLTGLRPSRERFLSYKTWADEDAPAVVDLPGYLKARGYTTISLGKVFHHQRDRSASWSRGPWHPRVDAPGNSGTHRNYQLRESHRQFRKDRKGPPVEAADVQDNAYYDGKIADRAVSELNRIAQQEQDSPFFMAVGFLKPHLPFNAPRKYWQLYDLEKIQPAPNPSLPLHAPKQAGHPWDELRKYTGIPGGREPVSEEMARHLRHGYYACVSYTDAQVGRVMQMLEATDLAENTIVFLLSDHGFSLGEHGLWAKHSPFDLATRIPLIVRGLGIPAGKRAAGLVELVDVYPTILDLLELPRPPHLAGQSFRPLLSRPERAGKDAVFPRWKNADVVRSGRYSYTQWIGADGERRAEMLFDLADDPGETLNLAKRPRYKPVIKRLRALQRSMEKQRGR